MSDEESREWALGVLCSGMFPGIDYPSEDQIEFVAGRVRAAVDREGRVALLRDIAADRLGLPAGALDGTSDAEAQAILRRCLDAGASCRGTRRQRESAARIRQELKL
jgi:hypothetical protein